MYSDPSGSPYPSYKKGKRKRLVEPMAQPAFFVPKLLLGNDKNDSLTVGATRWVALA